MIRILTFLGEAVTAGGRVISDVRIAYELESVLEKRRARPTGIDRPIAAVREIGIDGVHYAYQPSHRVIAGIGAGSGAAATP